MEKSQLVAIAVAAAVSVTLRELLSAAVSFARKKVAQETTKAKARKIFNRHTRWAIWSMFWLVVSVWLLVFHMRETTPISRHDILSISLWLGSSFFWINALMLESAQAFVEFKTNNDSAL